MEQFQEKCAAVFRPELRKKESERFRISVKNGNALGVDSWYDYMDIRPIEPMADGAS